MKFVIPYRITDADYIAFIDHHWRYTPVGRKKIRLVRLACLLIGVVVVLFAWTQHQDASLLGVQAVAVGITSTVLALLARPMMLKLLPARLRRVAKSGTEVFSPSGEYVFDFDNQTLTVNTPKMEAKVPFSSVTAFYETDKAVYLYVETRRAVLIPHNAFHSTEELARFCASARSAFQR